jgi:Mg2+ and Co2+ transporter CorA
VPALRERLINSAPGRQRLPDSPEALMLRLLNSMVDRYLELRQPLTSQLERWQRRLLDPRRPFRDWYLLLEARGELRKLEQLCEEQLDALQEWLDERLELAPQENGQLAASAPGPLSDALQVRANDVVSHIQRVHAHARRLQDSLESAIQLHFSSTAHRTNEIMRTLTTITAIFMPLTLITGIFGMNFEFIPGLHARAGFWIALAAMGAIALLLVAVFRARRYLSASSTRRRARTAKPRQGGTEKPRDGESAKPRGA